MSEERSLIVRKGTFKCISKAADLFSALLVVGLFFIAVVFVLSFINFGEDINMMLRRAAAVCIIMEGAFAAVRIMLSLGREYTYESGESDFVVTDPNGDKEYFYYSDVSDVEYTPIYSRKTIVGYEVKIASGIRMVNYRFVFGANADNKSTAATPFYCLEVNSNLREPEDFGKDKEQIMAQFERMQKSQKAEKKKTTRAQREKELMESIQQEKAQVESPKDEE